MTLSFGLVLALSPAVVTVQTGYGTVGSALEKVSAVSGVTLRAQGDVAREELLVSVSAVTLEDLRGRIAEATDATWTEAGGVWTLVRTAEDSARERNRAIASRMASLSKGVGAAAGEYVPMSNTDVAAFQLIYERARTLRDEAGQRAAWLAIRDLEPLARLGRALPGLLGTQEIARVPLNERRVFSLQPTRMQTEFPRGVREAHLAYLRDARRVFDSLPLDLQMNSSLARRGRGAEFEVEVRRSMNGTELSLLTDSALPTGDGDFTPYLDRVTVFNSIPWEDEMPAVMPELTEPMEMRFDEEMRTTLGGVLAEPGGSQFDARQGMRRWLVSVDAEPERVILPLALQAMASGGRDVVWSPMSLAYFSVLMIPMTSARGADGRPPGFPETVDLRPLFGYPEEWAGEWTVSGSWLVGRPASREDDRVLRADSRALLRLLQVEGTVTLRDLARFAAGSKSDSPDNENLLTATFLADIPQLAGLIRPETWPLLQLLGSLSDGEWAQLRELGRLSLENVSGARRRMLERTLYADLIGSDWPVDDRGEFSRAINRSGRVEPTRQFAAGLPARIEMRAQGGANDELMTQIRDERGQEGMRAVDLSTVAYWIVMRERGQTTGIPEVLGFELMTHEFEVMGVVFDGRWTRTAATDFQRLNRPGVLQMDELPEATRVRLEELIWEYRTQDLSPPRSGGGGVAPPVARAARTQPELG